MLIKNRFIYTGIIMLIMTTIFDTTLLNTQEAHENERVSFESRENEYFAETDNYLAFELANKTLQSIKNENFIELQKYIHDEKGVVFAYATTIYSDSLVFSKKQIGEFEEDDYKYIWGTGTHSDEILELTPREYFEKYLYTQDYLTVKKVSINNTIGKCNAVDNLEETFPNSIYVEFYYEGTEENGYLDWSSLKVVMEEYNGELKVVGLINSYYIM